MEISHSNGNGQAWEREGMGIKKNIPGHLPWSFVPDLPRGLKPS